MNNLWFTSDFHFNHANIIKYENRPFKNVENMNSTIIKKYNERVKETDICYYLGDWGFYASKHAEYRGEGIPKRIDELKNQLNGTIISVCGNHDKRSNKLNISTHRIVLNKAGIYINLIHKVFDADGKILVPLYDHVYYYPLTICGHVHSKWKTQEIKKDGYVGLVINVAVETNNYYPYNFHEIMSIYHRWLNGRPDKDKIKKLIYESNKGLKIIGERNANKTLS